MPKKLPISRKLRRALEELALAHFFFPRRSPERGRKHPYLEQVRYAQPGVLADIRDKARCVEKLLTRQLGDGPTPPPVWQLAHTDEPKADTPNDEDSAQGSARGSPASVRLRPRTRRRL